MRRSIWHLPLSPARDEHTSRNADIGSTAHEHPTQRQRSERFEASLSLLQALRSHSRAMWNDARLCLRRVLFSDLQCVIATNRERELLASSVQPIANAMVQDFMAWRRSMLWFGAAFVGLYAVLLCFVERTVEGVLGAEFELAREQGLLEPGMSRYQFVDQPIQLIGVGNVAILDTIQMILFVSVLVSAVLLIVAAASWRNLRLSRRWGMWAWGLMFASPFAVSLAPITMFMNFAHVDPLERDATRLMMEMMLALSMFMSTTPVAIALFPGIIRSAIALKTLLPESTSPGWIAVIMAPLYIVFLLVLAGVMIQLSGDMLLVGSVLCFIAGAVNYLWRAHEITRPHDQAEISAVISSVKKTTGVCNLIGIILAGMFLIRMPKLGWDDALRFMVGAGGSVILMTIVATDLMLSLVHKGYQQSQQFAGSDLQPPLDQKFAALSQAGLTDAIPHIEL